MISFSWKRINDKFSWKDTDVIQYFYAKQNVKCPAFFSEKIPKRVKAESLKPYPIGPCYLLNINDALSNAPDISSIYHYLELASKRNKFDYSLQGKFYLPTALVDQYLLDWINYNPMLEIVNDNIYFKYEQE